MSEFGTRLREHYDQITPPLDIERLMEQFIGADRQRQRHRPMMTLAAAAVLTLLVIGAVGVMVVSGNEGPDVIDAPPTVLTTQPSAANSESLIDAAWSLEAIYDDWLNPVAFDGGFAALRTLDPMMGGGDVWLSPDGVHWEEAPSQPPTVPRSLSSDGNTLFVETGDLFLGTGSIWVSSTGSDWRPAFTSNEYDRLFRIAEAHPYGWSRATAVASGAPGAVVFGVNPDGLVTGWGYDGNRFVPSEVGTISALPPDSTEISVVALDDRFLLYSYDNSGDTFDRYMMVSYSASGATWSDLALPPPDSPLALPDIHLSEVASADGLNLVSTSWGYGLWVTDDGSSWDEIVLLPADSNWIPHLAVGELGWIVFSPASRSTLDLERNSAHTGPYPANLGLWHSPDAQSWTSLNLGPLASRTQVGEVGLLQSTLVVGDQDVYVFAFAGESKGFGSVGNPTTEVWRLDPSSEAK